MIFFFFNDTATTEIYTLSLHDALPILPLLAKRQSKLHLRRCPDWRNKMGAARFRRRQRSLLLNHRSREEFAGADPDRKSTRLNSSHGYISYAVFCLKKKKASWFVRLRG